MNSFFYHKEVGNTSFLKYRQTAEEEIKAKDPPLPSLRGTKDGRFTYKAERLCQTLPTKQAELFVPSKMTKRRKKKTVFYEVDDEFQNIYSQNLFIPSNNGNHSNSII